APAAVDVDALERLQIGLVLVDKKNRIVLEPALPTLLDQLAGIEIEWQSEAERRLGVRVVGRGHAQVHDAVSFRVRKLFLAPDRLEEALDATVVAPFGESLALARGTHVESPGPAFRQPVLGELVERIRPVVPIDEIEVGVT